MWRYVCSAGQCKLANLLSACALLAGICYPLSANAIVGGQTDPNTAVSPWAGVGSLSVNGGTYTATAIGSRFILTAAHVVEGASAKNVSFNLNVGGELSQSIRASAIHVYPEYRGFAPSATDGLVHNDLAVIELSADLPTGVPVYTLLTGIPVTPPTITMVGYGMGGDGVNGATVSGSASVKRVGGNMVDMLVNGPNGNANMYMFDFDDVRGDRASANEAQFGSGDSGSPAFVQTNGVWRILGVNTFVATTAAGADHYKFGALGGGMLTSAYAGWIQGIVAAPQTVATAPQTDIVAPVPEPASLGMLLSGVALLLWIVRRRRNAV